MLKNIINSFLKIFDVKIVRYSSSLPLDFSQKTIHPRTLGNICSQQKSLINLDLKFGRTNRFYPLKQKSFDPHIFAITNALKNGLIENNLFEKILSLLKISKTKIEINNVIELLGLNNVMNKQFDTYPLWSVILPWENIEFAQKILNFPKAVKADRLKNGFLISSDDPTEIMRQDELYSISSHARQYVSLIRSIKKNGYIPDLKKNYIEVELLLKAEEFRWKPGGEGNHRATVIASLGIEMIKGLVVSTVRFEDAEYWPNVVNGIYQKKEAEIIFNRFFDSDPPECYNQWNSYCKKIVSNEP